MPARLPGEIRHRAIVLSFEGRTVEEIETALDGAASGSSIRNIISEVKRGVHQEFRAYREHLDEMRSLARRLRAGKLSLQEAATGLAVYEGVMQLGVDPELLRDQIELFQRISPSDFPVDQFNKAALRMSKREAQTGMTFEQLETRDIEMRSRIASDENRQRELTNNINSLTAAEENARRTLQERLAHNKTTEEDLQRFLQEQDTLHKAGLRPDEIRSVADLVEKCGTEEVLTAAKEMAVQVSKTGLKPQALVTEYNVIAELKEKAVGELNEARAGTRESQVELQQLQQAKVDQLSRNRVTDAQLTSFLATKQQLATWGISVEKMEPLKRVLAEIERHGFQPNNIVAVLQTIVGLQERKQQLEAEIANKKTELGSGTKNLQGINDEIVAKKTELASLQASENNMVSALSKLQLQIIQSRDRVELVEAFLQLLHDPSTIPDEHIRIVIGSLQQILTARATVRQFPIDYERLRGQFRHLFEEALGDKLIARETLDAETHKSNVQRARYVSMERELVLERSRLDHMSRAKLLKAAASQNREGVVFVGVCENCRATAAVRRGATSSYLNSYHCPCCWGTLDPRPVSKPK